MILKKGEVKKISFIIKDKNGNQIDCSGAQFEFRVKVSKQDSSPVISIDDSHFDKSNASDGKVSVVLDTRNLEPKTYIGELKIIFGSDNVDISDDIMLVVEPSVFD